MTDYGRLCLAIAAFLLGGVTGCDPQDKRKPVYPVTGKILIDNRPTKDVVISFHPIEEVKNPKALRSLTTTDADGTYKLTTYVTHDGAPTGEYVVTVYWPGKVPPGSPIGEVGPDQLKGKYADPTTSKLRATVREQSNSFDFNLP